MAPSARQRSAVSTDNTGNEDPRSHRQKRSTKRRKKLQLHYVPSHVITEWTRTNTILFVIGVVLLAVVNFTPLVMLEEAPITISEHPVSLDSLLEKSIEVRKRWRRRRGLGQQQVRQTNPDAPVPAPKVAAFSPPIPVIENVPWAPPRRGHIKCDVDVDDLVYWNDPQSTADQNFRSPFAPQDGVERFLSFEPDLGGWNNMRMSLEILLVFAAVTGRTLVLPPKLPMNLLGHGQTYARSFADFFPLDHPELRRHVKIITMKDFIEQHGRELLLSAVFTPDQLVEKMRPAIESCDHDTQSASDCSRLYVHLRQHGYQPKIHAVDNCFIFDETFFKFATTKSMTAPGSNVRKFCQNRTALAYAPSLTKIKWMHWQASDAKYQLLNHFYTFFFFTDPAIGNFYKRLVRDFLHYSDNIYCAAGKIVHALQQQRPQEGSDVEPSFSTLHVRRTDFRYHQVKLSGEEWVESTKQIFHPGEVLYIATDEHNRTFFSPLVEYGYEVRFLDDYYQAFGLSKLDRTYMGMIDSIVASHGRSFVGTWLSTFSGYIIRMRGYLGHEMRNTWYGFLPQQRAMHVPQYPKFQLLRSREWPMGWEGIDENATINIRLPQLQKMHAAAERRIHEDLLKPLANPVAEHIQDTTLAPPKSQPHHVEHRTPPHEVKEVPNETKHDHAPDKEEIKREQPKQTQAAGAQPEISQKEAEMAEGAASKDSKPPLVETKREKAATVEPKGSPLAEVKTKSDEINAASPKKEQIPVNGSKPTTPQQVAAPVTPKATAAPQQVPTTPAVSKTAATSKPVQPVAITSNGSTNPKQLSSAPGAKTSTNLPKGVAPKQPPPPVEPKTTTAPKRIQASTSAPNGGTPKQVIPADTKTTPSPKKLQTSAAESKGATPTKAPATPVPLKGTAANKGQISTEKPAAIPEAKGGVSNQVAKKEPKAPPKQRTKPRFTVSDLIASNLSDAVLVRDLPLARGITGRPMAQTPALIGARRGHIDCEVNVDSLAYWNDPQGERDRNFKSPYAVKGDQTKYLTFIPDAGGWNNIRMGMETIFVFAVATGRTLVLPPEEALYLLTGDKKDQYRGFGDFFPLHTAELQKRVPIISTEEFVRREGGPGGRLPLPEANKTKILKAVKHCEYRAKSPESCFPLWDYLENVGRVPQIGSNYAPGKPSAYHCVIFDEDVYHGGKLKPELTDPVMKFCGQRNLTYWTNDMEDPVLLHFKTKDGATRLLVHFYAFMLFTNPVHDNYFKRFVRDFLHYNDRIYCAAGKIIKALQVEAHDKGFHRDSAGNGGFSSLHVRRGDFQYKEVKISGEAWYNNTKELWQPNEILYIATDERNKTFFDALAEHHELRFLDDYWSMANLSNLDPNFMGMIDTIIASRGRVFVGTWFSTFSGYINRMRGYHGLSMKDSWYSWLPRKTAVQTWGELDGRKYSFEVPLGWIGIDGDTWASKDVF